MDIIYIIFSFIKLPNNYSHLYYENEYSYTNNSLYLK